ncbi:hypothetical protein HGP29_28445 [Flammeovirga sp. SR4]|uniref:Lipoprotein n=2 Tax=Flammeovirga agarivorans TaxID=2726742 RepID=A0A7X8SRP4_9BACT|nr:hypothetical protein [Flammeovirga agarivorans]
MKRYLNLSLLLLLMIGSCKVKQLQFKRINISDNKYGLECSYFKGTIFTEKYPFPEYLVFNSSVTFWTPSNLEISDIENKLSQRIHKLSKNNPFNGVNDCPKIHKNLNNYYRQYVSFINNKGDKIIQISFFWDKNKTRYNLNEDYMEIFDGCSYYWRINYNIDTGEFFGLSINGIA